jgi:hypothetical protein
MTPADQGDDNNVTFLAEFRALRNRAGLDYGELAARAHYPSDVLKGAEAGPDLPTLPILVAYVRACDADVVEWEERWRRLDSGEPDPLTPDDEQDDCGLPVRPAGASPAAKAGARVTVAPADVHDPERIRAALRAHRDREEKAGPGSSSTSGNGAASGNGSGWASDTDGPNGGTTNGGTTNGGTTMLANDQHRQYGEQASVATTYSAASAPATSWSSVTPEPAEWAAPPEPAATSGFTAESEVPELAASHSPATGLYAANGHSSPNGNAPGQRNPRGTRGTKSSGNATFKLAALVLVVVIACIILIALL